MIWRITHCEEGGSEMSESDVVRRAEEVANGSYESDRARIVAFGEFLRNLSDEERSPLVKFCEELRSQSAFRRLDPTTSVFSQSQALQEQLKIGGCRELGVSV